MANTTGPWDIYLYGTNTKITTDANNEVSLASLPTVNVASGWNKISVLAVKTNKINFDGKGEVQGGVFLDSFSQYKQITVETEYLHYTNDIAIINSIESVFGYKQKFICMDGQGQATEDKYIERFHTSGKALEIRLVSREKEWHEDGWIKFSLELRCGKPL